MEDNTKNINIFLNFLNKIENKEQTLYKYLDNLMNIKIINANKQTERIIQQEINSYKELLLTLQKRIIIPKE